MRPGNGQSRRLRPASASRTRSACTAAGSRPMQAPRHRPSWNATQEPLPASSPSRFVQSWCSARVLRARARRRLAGGTGRRCLRHRPRRRAAATVARGPRVVVAEPDRPQLAGIAQPPVEQRPSFLDQPRLGHQRAELAGRLDPFDAPRERGEFLFAPRRRDRRSAQARGSRGSSPCRHRAARRLRRKSGRRLATRASRRRSRGRSPAATSARRAAGRRCRRVARTESARRRCAGNRPARARRRARGGAHRSRCRSAASRHRGCGRGSRASAHGTSAPCIAGRAETDTERGGIRSAGIRNRSARCARRRAAIEARQDVGATSAKAARRRPSPR